MKAEELMIGDWIYLPSIISDDKYPVRVLEIHDDCVRYYCGGKKMLAMYKHIEPIPLTPGILEKNGFIRHVYGFSLQHFKLQGNLGEDNIVYFTITVYGKEIRVDYVHQLQHALRLCEIEKEIVI